MYYYYNYYYYFKTCKNKQNNYKINKKDSIVCKDSLMERNKTQQYVGLRHIFHFNELLILREVIQILHPSHEILKNRDIDKLMFNDMKIKQTTD